MTTPRKKSTMMMASEEKALCTDDRIMAVMGDEDTVVGFLLGGIGQICEEGQVNFFVVERDTTVEDIEENFRRLIKLEAVDIILITTPVAERIRYTLQTKTEMMPIVLEIPSKDRPYRPSKDALLTKAANAGKTEDFEK